MTTDTTDRQLVWVVLAVLAALLVVPAIGMGFGVLGMGSMMGSGWSHGMWGASDGAPGWLFALGVGLQLLFLALVAGAGYLAYRAVTTESTSRDPALEELRSAYARGELDDDEYERRRERLESDQ